MKYLNDAEKKRYLDICKYTKNFSNDELVAFENEVFGNLTEYQKVSKEFARLRTLLTQRTDLYAKYIDDVVDIERMLKVVDFDSSVLDEIALRLVNIQLELNAGVRMFSVLPKLQKQYEYTDFKRFNEKNKKGTRTK